MASIKHKMLEFEGLHILLALHSTKTPETEGWDTYLDAYEDGVKKWGKKLLGSLAVTDGGGPDAKQRAELAHRLIQPYPHIRGAVVTNSVIARGIITAISWLKGNARAFGPNGLGDALEHLQMPRAHEEEVWQVLLELAESVPSTTVKQMGTLYEKRRMIG